MNKEQLSKDYITEALLQLMGKMDYDKITITEITKKAGVNRVTFYRNFNSKDDIIKECLLPYNPNKSNENGMFLILKYFSDNRNLIKLLYKSKCQHLLLEHILNNWNYDNEDNNIIAYTKSAWAYFIYGWANEWYLRGMKESPEDMMKIWECIQKENH